MNIYLVRNVANPEEWWSNEGGWSDLDEAIVWTSGEQRDAVLPDGGEWIPFAAYPQQALWFSPDAIRDHFDADEDFEPLLEAMSHEDLVAIGQQALMDDRLYENFHETLCDAVRVVAREGGK